MGLSTAGPTDVACAYPAIPTGSPRHHEGVTHADDNMSTVVVTRRAGPRRDRRRSYRVYVDHEKVGKLRPGESLSLTVGPGYHVLRLAIDWCASPKVGFDAPAGEFARFTCEPNGGWARVYFDVTVNARRYIRVVRESAQPTT